MVAARRTSKRTGFLSLWHVLVAVFISISFVAGPVSAQVTPQHAPLNPLFKKYLVGLQQGELQTQTDEGHPLGYVPAPLKLPKFRAQFAGIHADALPTTYDLRPLKRVTSVKNQGNCGSCWAFATYASLESYLRKVGQTWDFAEADMNDYHGFDIGICDGGNEYMSTAYLARYSGPVEEKDNPYPYSVKTYDGLTVKKHVQNVRFLPDRMGAGNAKYLDNATVKNAVMTYGAVFVMFNWQTSAYNSATYSYYYTGTGVNHAVAIVGWDDNYPKTKFSTQPPGNGAFIVKNSWGTSWGEKGYFYMSYYDASLIVGSAFNNAEPPTNFTRVYQYDPLGWVTSLGYGTNTAWFANVFKTSYTAPTIGAVSLYTPVDGCSYTLYIYNNVTLNTASPRNGALKLTKAGTIANAGYNTIKFKAIPLTAGKNFSVVVQLTTPSYTYPIPVEEPSYGYSSGAKAYQNQSFISSNGTAWEDIGISAYFPNTNVCLKAFGKP